MGKGLCVMPVNTLLPSFLPEICCDPCISEPQKQFWKKVWGMIVYASRSPALTIARYMLLIPQKMVEASCEMCRAPFFVKRIAAEQEAPMVRAHMGNASENLLFEHSSFLKVKRIGCCEIIVSPQKGNCILILGSQTASDCPQKKPKSWSLGAS